MNFELDDTEARNVIRALSVHARDLAATDSTRAKALELDETRHRLEKELDQHNETEASPRGVKPCPTATPKNRSKEA